MRFAPRWYGLAAAVCCLAAVLGTARAMNPAVARCLAAAMAVEVKDAAGNTLRTVNGTLVPEGVIVQTSALAGAASAEIRGRDGNHWTSQNVLVVHPVVGLSLLEIPQSPDYALNYPASGAFTPATKVTVLAGPGSTPDSVSSTIYYSFSMRDGTDYVSAYPGLAGAAPVVDDTGRFLGVMSDLSVGGIACWSVVPVISVKAIVNARGTPTPITSAATVQPPGYEDGKSAYGLTFRGASLVTAQKGEDARTLLNSALKKEPTNADAHYWLGRLLFADQQYDQAAKEFLSATNSDPGYHMAWHMAGAAYNQAGRYLEAEKMYNKALEVDPQSAETYNNLGGAYINEHRDDKAIEAFRKSIAIDPGYSSGLASVNLARTLLRLGRRPEAEQVYNNLAAINGDYAKRVRSVLDGK